MSVCFFFQNSFYVFFARLRLFFGSSEESAAAGALALLSPLLLPAFALCFFSCLPAPDAGALGLAFAGAAGADVFAAAFSGLAGAAAFFDGCLLSVLLLLCCDFLLSVLFAGAAAFLPLSFLADLLFVASFFAAAVVVLLVAAPFLPFVESFLLAFAALRAFWFNGFFFCFSKPNFFFNLRWRINFLTILASSIKKARKILTYF